MYQWPTLSKISMWAMQFENNIKSCFKNSIIFRCVFIYNKFNCWVQSKKESWKILPRRLKAPSKVGHVECLIDTIDQNII